MRITRRTLAADIQALLPPAPHSGVLMVHASVRSVGPILGGAAVLVQALFDALAPDGTLAAYVDFEPFYEDDERDDVPVFDPRIAPAARDHGIFHETLRTWPGALRSAHPDAGVVAIGPKAQWIVDPHPFHYGYGEGTPFERIIQTGGHVLMIGAPLDTITLLHYAEHKARIPDKRIVRYQRLMMPGPQWVSFEEFDTADPVNDKLPQNCFEQIAGAFLATGQGVRGPIGNAPSFLFEAPALVNFGIEWLEAMLPS